MTATKNKIIALIENIPDEQTRLLNKILANIRELIDADSQWQDEIYSRAEQDLALIEDAESLTHEESPATKEAT